MQHGNPNSRFHISEFPVPLRGSAEGPQNPDFMFPSVQIPRYSSANSRFRVSEFPRFQGPSVGPRREPCNFQIPCFLVGRFQDTPPQIPDSKIPSVQIPGTYSRANSRFRVSEFPRPPLGSEPKGPPNSRFRVSEFPRPPLRTSSARGTPIFQNVIPRALYVRRAQIPEYREQFLFPLLYSRVTLSVPASTRGGGEQ